MGPTSPVAVTLSTTCCPSPPLPPQTRNRIKKQIGFGVPQRVALVQCTVPNSWLEDWVFATHERMKAIGMGHIPHVVLTRAGSWNQTEADRCVRVAVHVRARGGVCTGVPPDPHRPGPRPAPPPPALPPSRAFRRMHACDALIELIELIESIGLGCARRQSACLACVSVPSPNNRHRRPHLCHVHGHGTHPAGPHAWMRRGSAARGLCKGGM